jgi:hypothetical protein
VTDSPPTIAALIAALEAAIAKLSEATSFQQRKARNTVVINRGLALHARLSELQRWLATNRDHDAYLGNLSKYEEGWDALNGAMEFTREYKKLHWEELADGDSGHRPRRRSHHTKHDPRPAHPQGHDHAAPAPDREPVLRVDPVSTQRALL